MKNYSTSLFLHSCCWILLLLMAAPAQATHIVGGEMNYRCLGNNRYEISLTVFRDCDTGVPPFDNPAAIGIYVGQSNVLFARFDMLYQGLSDTLDIFLPDSCLTIRSSACIHTITYVDTVLLPFNPSGYTLAYQRCCRNQDIVNIVNPNDAGATYWTFISPQALQVCNSSATFREWPRVYLCSGVPVMIDHSAVDADGDSLVYEMCTPSDGFFPTTPAPAPAGPPPYPNIIWSPGYTTSNMLGNGADPLRINPSTGLLEGTPQTLGVFLVGVCLKEYRNGILISQTRRDFQHVVGTCPPQTTASFDTIKPPCSDNLLYGFSNTSQTVTGGYRWFFDNLGTTTSPNPSYTFPDTGLYTITLVAGIGTPCLDTFERVINVQRQAVNLAAIPSITACAGDTITLTANNINAGFSASTSYTWGPSSAILSGQGTNTVRIIANQNIAIGVQAQNSFNCTDTVTTFITIQDFTADFGFTLPTCDSTLAVNFQNLSTSNPPNNTYRWNFDNLGTAISTNSTFTFPDTGQYNVSLIIGEGTVCPDTIIKPVNVQIQALDLVALSDITACADDTFGLRAINLWSNYSNVTYTWRSTAMPLDGQGTDSTTWAATGTYTISLSASQRLWLCR